MIEVNFKLERKDFNIELKETFPKGITGVFGPSGSGKTSLLLAISGLVKPSEGAIFINGRKVFHSETNTDVPVERRNIGYVFQEGRLFPHLTVKKNLIYGYKDNSKINFEEVVELLNIKHLLKNKPMQISGGERQRTALGRSLLSSPEILLLDEPFSAVDTSLRKQILPFVIRIQQKVNIPILIVSHDLPDLLKLTDTLIVIKDGKCLGHGKYYNLMKDNSVAEIFGSGTLVNSIDMKVIESAQENGLTILGVEKGNEIIQVKCEKSKDRYEEGKNIKIFINADDIALSTSKLEGVTIQNQLKGEVTDIIHRDATLLCVVDVGFTLVVEITDESRKRMNIQIGSKIWCLFKSAAIDMAA